MDIGYTKHRTKTSKAKNTTQKTKTMSNMDPTKNNIIILIFLYFDSIIKKVA
jgi:hypothetical protein